MREIWCICERQVRDMLGDVGGTLRTVSWTRCRVLCSGGRTLWVEEIVLCGLSCSMCVSRCSALGSGPPFAFSSSELMWRLSFSLRSTRRMPPLFWPGCGFALLAGGGRALFHASVASLNSTAFSGSSILPNMTSWSSIIKSLCKRMRKEWQEIYRDKYR